MISPREIKLMAQCVFCALITLGAIGITDANRNKIPMSCFFGLLIWAGVSSTSRKDTTP